MLPIAADGEQPVDDHVEVSRVLVLLHELLVGVVGIRVAVAEEVAFAEHEQRVFFQRRLGPAEAGFLELGRGLVVTAVAVEVHAFLVEGVGEALVGPLAYPATVAHTDVVRGKAVEEPRVVVGLDLVGFAQRLIGGRTGDRAVVVGQRPAGLLRDELLVNPALFFRLTVLGIGRAGNRRRRGTPGPSPTRPTAAATAIQRCFDIQDVLVLASMVLLTLRVRSCVTRSVTSTICLRSLLTCRSSLP